MLQFVPVHYIADLREGDTVKVKYFNHVTRIKSIERNWVYLEEEPPQHTSLEPLPYGAWELHKQVDMPYKLPPVPKHIYEFTTSLSDIDLYMLAHQRC